MANASSLKRDSYRLYVRQRGSGTPAVLLHGLGSSSRYWGDMRPVSDRFRTLAPDLLGFGHSPQPVAASYTPEQHCAALHHTLTALTDRPFHLIAHSMGSALALHFAACHPEMVRQLVLISLPVLGQTPWGHAGSDLQQRWHRFEAHSAAGIRLFESGRTLLRPLWQVIGPRLRRDIPPAAVRDALGGSWRAYWRTLESVVYGQDFPALLARLERPPVLIHGVADTTAPFAAARALARSCRVPLVEIAGAGHNPYYTHFPATSAAIDRVLDGEVTGPRS